MRSVFCFVGTFLVSSLHIGFVQSWSTQSKWITPVCGRNVMSMKQVDGENDPFPSLPFFMNVKYPSQTRSQSHSPNMTIVSGERTTLEKWNRFVNETWPLIRILPNVGIPLNIFSFFSTYQHYGYNILTWKLVLLQFLLGFYTYGKDKYFDALQFSNNTTSMVLNEDKLKLYTEILRNKEFFDDIFKRIYDVILLIFFSFDENAFMGVIFWITYKTLQFAWKHKVVNNISIFSAVVFFVSLVQNHLLPLFPFVLLLDSTDQYIEIKKKNELVKPFFVSFMWVAASLILPSVIHDHDYSILRSPESYLPPFLTIFAFSNLADIADKEEDRSNDVVTFPVKYGNAAAALLSAGCLWIVFHPLYNYAFMAQAHNDDNTFGYFVIKTISSILPYFDSIGHNVLHANNELINNIVNSDILSNEMKANIILSSIKLAQMGDNFGTYLLQLYYNIVHNCT